MTANDRVRQAVAHGGVRAPDERGLMPLDEARAHLAGIKAFEKGGGRDGGEVGWVLDSDIAWAALLSLADAEEFVAAASRLKWKFSPRGFDNIDLYLRYGEGIVPWLATRLVNGVLTNTPWCVLPCLLACGSAAAFDLVWRVATVEGKPHTLDIEWLARHPEGAAFAAIKANAGDYRALSLLAALWARGTPVADAARPIAAIPWADGGAWSAPAIVALLDAFAARRASRLFLWPSAGGTGPRRCHALRAIAVRAPGRWVLAILRIEGERASGVYPVRIAAHLFGSHVMSSANLRGARTISLPLDLTGAPPEIGPWLIAHASTVWPSLAELPLDLPADAEIVATVDDPPLDGLPSTSSVWQDLARVLAG
jgi:hypothetical protein